MIRKGDDVHQGLFIGMNAPDHFDRLVYQCPLTIDFHFIFRHFADLSNLPLKWFGSWQGPVIALNRGYGYAMIIASNPSNTYLCQFIPYLHGVFLRDKDFKFYICKFFHELLLYSFLFYSMALFMHLPFIDQNGIH